jgi:hypothetical protein
MIENLIVALIVGAAGWSAWAKYRPGKKAGCGTGGGCETCGACETAQEPEQSSSQRVIKIHVQS